MQLPTHERKILEAANQASEFRQPSAWMVILGGAAGLLLIIAGIGESLEKVSSGLRTIGSGVIWLGFFGMMYEYQRFRSAALSLIKKLQAPQTPEH